jgi:hypothetical protein
LVDQIFFQCAAGKPAKASRSSWASRSICSTLRSWRPSGGDDLELFGDVFGVGLGEDGADRGGDHLLVALRDDREHVAHEVDPAPLPAGADQDRGDRGLQAGVGIADDQLGPAKSAGLQAA